MQHKINLLKLIFLIVFLSFNARANKLSFSAGFFSIDAAVGETDTTLSGFGSYKFSYHSNLIENLEVMIGYSVLIEGVISGDKSFGPSIGFGYYPFGSKTSSHSSIGSFTITAIKNLNPYVSMGFTQRQYQSVKSSYSGFSFGGGAEFGFNKKISFFSDFTYSILQGPNQGEVTEMIASIGLIFNYK